jgi:hypothetical protein
MIVRPLVLGHAQPVHSGRSNGGLWIFLQNLLVKLFRIGPILLHDGHTRQAHQQLRRELVFRQVALNAESLFAIFVENNNGWRPDRFKAPESGWVFLDVNSNGNEILFDERRELRIAV